MLTNWLGYLLLAGAALLLHPAGAAARAGRSATTACNGWARRLVLAAGATSWPACARGDRIWTVRGHELYLPPLRMALLQLAISCVNWTLMAA